MKIEKIAMGCDHRGYPMKLKLIAVLTKMGYQIDDLGSHSDASCDYPDFAIEVAESVQKGKTERGILICNSGVGMSITANKVKGIRAALCRTVEDAIFSRQHNNANVLTLGAGVTKFRTAKAICLAWLQTEFEGGRHENRVSKISSYEQNHSC